MKTLSIFPFGALNLPTVKLPKLTNPFKQIAALQEEVAKLREQCAEMSDDVSGVLQDMEEFEREMERTDFATTDYVDTQVRENTSNLVLDDDFEELKERVVELDETLANHIKRTS